MEPTGVAAVVALAEARSARLVAVTGGVAAGKSTFAGSLADALPGDSVIVASDGFLFPNAELEARGLTARKGFPESYDTEALAAFLDAARGSDVDAAAPVYSHRTYDIVPGERVTVGDADVVIVEGLHLASNELGVRQRFDLVVQLDAADEDLERWYLERFRSLRVAAADDPSAYLHAYVAMGGDALDAIALDVWRTVNLVVLHEHARPAGAHADIVLHLDADHAVARVTGR
jgi:type I pantothenate kinase